jgi:hypothetical protein
MALKCHVFQVICHDIVRNQRQFARMLHRHAVLTEDDWDESLITRLVPMEHWITLAGFLMIRELEQR